MGYGRNIYTTYTTENGKYYKAELFSGGGRGMVLGKPIVKYLPAFTDYNKSFVLPFNYLT